MQGGWALTRLAHLQEQGAQCPRSSPFQGGPREGPELMSSPACQHPTPPPPLWAPRAHRTGCSQTTQPPCPSPALSVCAPTPGTHIGVPLHALGESPGSQNQGSIL